MSNHQITKIGFSCTSLRNLAMKNRSLMAPRCGFPSHDLRQAVARELPGRGAQLHTWRGQGEEPGPQDGDVTNMIKFSNMVGYGGI